MCKLTNGNVCFSIIRENDLSGLADQLIQFLHPYFYEVENMNSHFTINFRDYSEMPEEWLSCNASPITIRKSTAAPFNLKGFSFFIEEGIRVVVDAEHQTSYHINECLADITFYGSSKSLIHLLEFVRYLSLLIEETSGTMLLHASATVHNGKCFMVLGNKGAGKTSTVFKLVFREGHQYFSGDKVLVSRSGDRLMIRGWPDYPHVGMGTLRNYPEVLDKLGISTYWPDGSLKLDKDKELIAPNDLRSLMNMSEQLVFSDVGALIFPNILSANSCMAELNEADKLSLAEMIEYPHDFLTVKWHNLFEEERMREPVDYTEIIHLLKEAKWLEIQGNPSFPFSLL